MSLTQIIAGNQLILISLVLVLSPLVLALAFYLIALLRKRRSQRIVEPVTIAEETTAMEVTAAARMTLTAVTTSAPQPGSPATSAEKTLAQAAKGADTAQPQKPVEAEGSDPAINSLLSDVFADEQALNRAELLLRDRSPVLMDDLVTLAETVTQQIKTIR